MNCKYCSGSNHRKTGYSIGFQRYNCEYCGRNWTMRQGKSYSNDIRFKALKLYLEGLGFRSIGRILGVSNVTLLKWIRSMGEKLFESGPLWKKTDLKSVAHIQIDEFWNYEAVAIENRMLLKITKQLYNYYFYVFLKTKNTNMLQKKHSKMPKYS